MSNDRKTPTPEQAPRPRVGSIEEAAEREETPQEEQARVLGGKPRPIGPSEGSEGSAEAGRETARAALAVGEDKLPAGRVKFLVDKAVHIDRTHLTGIVDPDGLSVEVLPSKEPIQLPKAVAASLQKQGFGRVAG